MKGNRILVGREVKEALNTGAPVVAMETGFLSHREGNRNHVADALQIMNTVRAHDAVPAVVAVDDGKMLVGMTEEELARFLEQPDLIKCNQRDVCVAVERRLHGATTISATLHAASLLGICIVASGGIGGVHREVQTSFDISPDLNSISRFPGLIVCSGAKTILDIPKTVECIETKGITAVGYQTDYFPSYYFRDSGIRLEHTCRTPEEAASILISKTLISDESGLLILNPVRKEAAQDRDRVEASIARALEMARAKQVSGKRITTFLIDEVEREMGEGLVETSFYIKKDNADLAARIAVAYSKLQREQTS